MYAQQTVAARALSVTDAREPSMMDAVVCKATRARYMYTTLEICRRIVVLVLPERWVLRAFGASISRGNTHRRPPLGSGYSCRDVESRMHASARSARVHGTRHARGPRGGELFFSWFTYSY